MSQSAKRARVPVSVKRILVAEDNLINQKVAVRLLKALGYESDVAQNGAEALSLLDTGRYAAILMDIDMPVMDGIAATSAIRSADSVFAGIPIIAFTANAFEGTRQKCLAAGMNDFLTKPVEASKFAAAIEHWTSAAADQHKLSA